MHELRPLSLSPAASNKSRWCSPAAPHSVRLRSDQDCGADYQQMRDDEKSQRWKQFHCVGVRCDPNNQPTLAPSGSGVGTLLACPKLYLTGPPLTGRATEWGNERRVPDRGLVSMRVSIPGCGRYPELSDESGYRPVKGTRTAPDPVQKAVSRGSPIEGCSDNGNKLRVCSCI